MIKSFLEADLFRIWEVIFKAQAQLETEVLIK